MKVGALRHLVTLQNPSTPVADGDGGSTVTWTELFHSVPASIEPATARLLERTIASTVIAQATHLVKLRYVAGVTTKTRVLFGSRILYVLGVANVDERSQELHLVCSEVVA